VADPAAAPPEAASLDPWSLLGCAAARGAALGVACVLLFFVLLAAISSFDGFLSTGPVAFSGWDLAFVGLLGLTAAPLTVVEERWRRRAEGLRSAAAVAGVVTLVAALALVAAYLQVTYAFTIRARGPAAALDSLGGSAAAIASMRSETLVLVAAYAPAFGFTTFGRLRGWKLASQVLVACAGTLFAYYASVQGFDSVPIARWLAGSEWAHPIVGTLVYLLPVPLGVLLPLTGWALDRHRARRFCAHAGF
jgi:hypothetical protein